MIDLLKTPREGSYILDGNDTFIQAQLLNLDNYIEAEIKVSNQILYTQVWSVDNTGVTVQNLRYLLRSSFDIPFAPITSFSNNIAVLSKKVTITLRERAKRTRSLQTETLLPSFNVLPSQNPVSFDFTQEIALLRDSAAPINVRPDKGIRIPYYANYQDPVTLKVSDEIGNVIHTHIFNYDGVYNQDIPAQSFNYIDLPSIAQDPSGVLSLIGYNAFFSISLTIGETTITQQCYYHRNSVYGYKEVYFKNNFLLFEQAIFYGMIQEGLKLDPQSYRDQNNQDVTYEIPADKEVSISSGYVFQEQNMLIAAIAQSIDIRLRENDKWLVYLSDSKSLDTYESLLKGYNHELRFTRNYIVPIENEASSSAAVFMNDATFAAPYNTTIEVFIDQITALMVTTAPLEKIRFIQPPTDGSLVSQVSFAGNVGAVTMFIYNETDAQNWLRQYDFDALLRLRYNPRAAAPAAITDTVGVQVRAGGVWSNIAVFTFNISDQSTADDFGPSVDAGTATSFIDNSGSGSVVMTPSYSDGVNNNTSFLWAVEQGDGVLSDPGVENPTYTQSNKNNGDVDVLSVTVTDNVNKKSSINYVEVTAVQYGLSIYATKDEESSSDTNHIYDVQVTGGAPGETVDIKHIIRVSDISQYARVGVGAAITDRFVIAQGQSIKTKTYTFTDNGTTDPVVLDYTLEIIDTELVAGIELVISIENASGDQEVIVNTQQIDV